MKKIGAAIFLENFNASVIQKKMGEKFQNFKFLIIELYFTLLFPYCDSNVNYEYVHKIQFVMKLIQSQHFILLHQMFHHFYLWKTSQDTHHFQLLFLLIWEMSIKNTSMAYCIMSSQYLISFRKFLAKFKDFPYHENIQPTKKNLNEGVCVYSWANYRIEGWCLDV